MHVIDTFGLRGNATSQWKGDDIQYRTAHNRLASRRGRPTRCDLCGTTSGWLEWALKHEPEMKKLQIGGVGDGMYYSPRPDDYIPLCRACHRRYDGRERDPSTGRYV